MTRAGELIEKTDADADILTTVNGDETWYFFYDPQTKRRSSKQNTKFCLDKRKGK